LATVSRRQVPQVTPVGFGADEDRLYLNIKHDSVKARNIRKNPRGSFVVDDMPSWEVIRGVLVNGTAELISGGELHGVGRDLIYEKYPRYEEEYGVRENGWSKYILVITPARVQSWGLGYLRVHPHTLFFALH
jgi:nitroimidazol reductase NimA-like FMN-containing flavoprotein (pyridoxamine 5'-phosphate oxidase superfamily)